VQRIHLLCLRMKNFSRLFIVAILGVLATGVTAETSGCKGCDPKEQESSIRDKIRADRAKYDRENEKITARPWDLKKADSLRGEKPSPEEKK
jgi:hypothetical protein